MSEQPDLFSNENQGSPKPWHRHKMKKHKVLFELVAKRETPMGGIPISTSIEMCKKFGKTAEKFGFDCYLKGIPKEALEETPANASCELCGDSHNPNCPICGGK